jgi:ligand-binding sensor domain-containing protein
MKEDVHGYKHPTDCLWVAFRSTAVVHINPDGTTKLYGRQSGLKPNTLDRIVALADGSVWVAGGSSLFRLEGFADLTSYELQCYGASAKLEKMPDAMQHVPPKSLVEDVDGSLLLSTQGRGIWRCASGQWAPFQPSGVSLGSPWSLYSDSSGRLWFGYGDNHIVVRTGDGYKTIRGKGTYEDDPL